MDRGRGHLNSLGFVIGASHGRALIAWGLDDAGERMSIDQACRGGKQGLRCECGASLVAKKGEIREHHFAHNSGLARHCAIASRAAVTKFVADTLLDAGALGLPMTLGRRGSAAVLAVSEVEIGGMSVLLVDAQRARQLAVYARFRRENLEPIETWCRSRMISGMVIDLTQYRNRADEDIRSAIRSAGLRKWLWRDERNDHRVGYQLLRRHYGIRS